MSKIIIQNATTNIILKFCANDSKWYIYVNDEIIKHRSSLGYYVSYPVTSFSSLDDAAEYLKKQGLLPKKFDVEELKTIQSVEIVA